MGCAAPLDATVGCLGVAGVTFTATVSIACGSSAGAGADVRAGDADAVSGGGNRGGAVTVPRPTGAT